MPSSTCTVVYTIGYGGRIPREFVATLNANRIKTIVDIRLRPDRASMGAYVKAKDPTKGIEGLLATGNPKISYISLVELGNVFLDFEDWAERYKRLIDSAGTLLTARLVQVVNDQASNPIALMCAEKKWEDCHRRVITDYLGGIGYTIKHL
jgi:uncharacterized protein (DUF488 family)